MINGAKMKSPFTGGNVRVVHEPATFKYRGQCFEVAAPQYECLDTQRRFTTTEQDEAFVAEVQRLYRERNFVPSATEIKATRQQYGLSAARMSALLGFGTNQYARYEAGETPTESNGTLVWLASHAEVFGLLVRQKAKLLRPRQFEQVQRRLLKLGARTSEMGQPAASQLALPLMTILYNRPIPAALARSEEHQQMAMSSYPEEPSRAAGDYSYAMAA